MPTPVSALLHSATLVTAGALLLYKNIYILNYNNSLCILIILLGGLSCIYNNISSINYIDIKRIVAYSTCTHISLIIMVLGIDIIYSSSSISMLHLFYHGWSKSLIFMICGYLISLVHSQDIRYYGSLYMSIPLIFVVINISLLNILGFIGTYLSYSKDLILELGLISIYGYNLVLIFILIILLSSGYSLGILLYLIYSYSYYNVFSYNYNNSYVVIFVYLIIIIIYLPTLLYDILVYNNISVMHNISIIDPFSIIIILGMLLSYYNYTYNNTLYIINIHNNRLYMEKLIGSIVSYISGNIIYYWIFMLEYGFVMHYMFIVNIILFAVLLDSGSIYFFIIFGIVFICSSILPSNSNNNNSIYKILFNSTLLLCITLISIIGIMNWPVSSSILTISSYNVISGYSIGISINLIGLYLTLILDILIWICIIYERYYIINKNYLYILIYYILNLIFFNNNDVILLCILYEFQSIPLLLMINNISGINIYNKKGLGISNILLIVYSIISGLLLYYSIYNMYLMSCSNNTELMLDMWLDVSYLISISILISGSIKLAIFPFHIWLGKVHVEAPTIGSILLAGISLKTGFYINYLFISLYNIISNSIINIMIYVLLIGIIINNIVIYYSIDGKRWIALYSIIHMNAYYIILLISKFSSFYVNVLIYGMIGHSLISSALFLIIGYIYDISNNKNVYLYSSIYVSTYLLYNLFILLLGNSSFPLLVLFIYELLAFINLSIYSVLFAIVLCILSCSNLLSSLFIFVKYYYDNLYSSINIYSSYDMIVVILSTCIVMIIFLMGISVLLPIYILC